MCKIIEFRPKESNGYKNLSTLFTICDTVESCNSYLEFAEQLFGSGYITEAELSALREIGRKKRLELANPAQKPEKAENPGTYYYTPEMGQQKPEGCQIEASRGYYGGRMYIDTPLALKGRGIKLIKTYAAADLTASGQYKTGWNSYQVTSRAYEKLKSQYSISLECCLD